MTFQLITLFFQIELLRYSFILTSIYLAGLQTIDDEIYEAAAIDGVNAWQKFWKITYSYNGTSVDGVYTGALTDDLLTKLDTLGNSGANTITATAQWEAQSQSAAGGNNGGGSSHKHKSSSNNNSTATATATATSTVVTVSGAKTGDNANIALLVVLIVLAGAGAAGILLYEKKRKRC